MKRWLEVPRMLPRKCAVTNHSTAENGPYFETDFIYFGEMGDTPLTLTLSAKALILPWQEPGAPRHLLPVERNADDVARIKELEMELEDLRQRFEVLRRVVEPIRSHFVHNEPPKRPRGKPSTKEPVAVVADMAEPFVDFDSEQGTDAEQPEQARA